VSGFYKSRERLFDATKERGVVVSVFVCVRARACVCVCVHACVCVCGGGGCTTHGIVTSRDVVGVHCCKRCLEPNETAWLLVEADPRDVSLDDGRQSSQDAVINTVVHNAPQSRACRTPTHTATATTTTSSSTTPTHTTPTSSSSSSSSSTTTTSGTDAQRRESRLQL
jgi:hypothetical protein